MRRPEILRPPVCLGSEISWTKEKRDEGEEAYCFLLPSGERLALMRAKDSRKLGDIPRLMSQGLHEDVLVEYGDPRSQGRLTRLGLEEAAREILHHQFGFRRRLDASYWAEKVARGDSIVDRIFPHWLFISILAKAQFGRDYSLGRPRFFTYRPSLEVLEGSGLSKEDLDKFEAGTPPILAGTAVPLLGNFGSTVGIGTRPEYVVLRQRTVKTARNQLSFPGGRSDSLLELTAWEELKEEMPAVILKPGSRGVDGSITMLLRKVDFLAVADQILIDEEGNLCRFLNYAFAFWFAFPYSGGGPQAFVSTEEHLGKIRGEDGDLGGEWRPALFDQETMELADPGIRDNLSPIAEIAMDAVKNRLKSTRK